MDARAPRRSSSSSRMRSSACAQVLAQAADRGFIVVVPVVLLRVVEVVIVALVGVVAAVVVAVAGVLVVVVVAHWPASCAMRVCRRAAAVVVHGQPDTRRGSSD